MCGEYCIVNKFFGHLDDGLHIGPKHVVVSYISLRILILLCSWLYVYTDTHTLQLCIIVSTSGLRVRNDCFKFEEERNASMRTSGNNNYVVKRDKPEDTNTQHRCCINFRLRKIQSAPLTFWCFSQSSVISENIGNNVKSLVESSWNVMAHGDAREGKWRGETGEWCG